jgi:hypothetical protein
LLLISWWIIITKGMPRRANAIVEVNLSSDSSISWMRTRRLPKKPLERPRLLFRTAVMEERLRAFNAPRARGEEG